MRTLEDYKRIAVLLRYEPESGLLFWKTKDPKRIKRAGTKKRDGYVYVIHLDKYFLAHRVIWFILYGSLTYQIDHANTKRDDNRQCNLRAASHVQNTVNRGPQRNNKTGHKGVIFHKSTGKYIAQIGSNKKTHRLGSFETAEAAGAAYAKAAGELHGEFARH